MVHEAKDAEARVVLGAEGQRRVLVSSKIS